MIGLWRLFQGGEMCIGYLPDAGGTMEQPIVMLQAFALMSDFEHRLKRGVGGAEAVPLNDEDEVDWNEVNQQNASAFGVKL